MSPGERRPWLEAWAWLFGLGALFFLSYGFANWVTSLRANVPEVAFAWERRIPFLPWSIAPYWSTDLFYAGALLLSATRDELRTLAKRLLATQAICIAGFLLFPLRDSWAHPAASGWAGDLFTALLSFDHPFNQAPSLHVALTAVLWVAYGRHLRGWALWLVRAWLAVAAVSTLTTYQHHFIDLPTGLVAGMVAVAMVPDGPAWARARDPLRVRLAAIYTIGVVIFVADAAVFRGWALVLLWPAVSLTVVAAAFWSGRAEVFRKRNGAMSREIQILITPYLIGAWMNLRWQTRAHAPAHEIADGVWVGRKPDKKERAPFASIVDVTAEFPFPSGNFVYRGSPMLDPLAPEPERLQIAVDAIRELSASRPTLVCCAMGYSRSAATAAAWLIDSGRAASVGEAVSMVRVRRSCVMIPPHFCEALERWAKFSRLTKTRC